MEDEYEQSGGSRFGGRWAALGGAVLAIAIAGGAWVAVTGHGGTGKSAAVTSTVTVPPASPDTGRSNPGDTGTETASATSRAAAPTRCGFASTWSSRPVTSAPDVTWQQVGALAAPVSAKYGPAKVSGPDGAIRQCYQHSPTGAVLAAVNITIGGSDTAAGNQVVDKQFTPGKGKQEALDQEATEGTATIAGFQVQACTATKCLVSVAVSGNGNYGAATVPLVWSAGDWMVDGTVAGTSAGQPIDNLSGYVPFSPGGAS